MVFQNFVISTIFWHNFILFFWDNYSKPTWGLACLRFAYPWFKTLYFAHLNFNPLPTFGFSVKKQLLQPKQNITWIKKLGFEFFWKSLEGFVSLYKDKDSNTCFQSWVQVSLKEFIRFVPTFQIFLRLGQVMKKKKILRLTIVQPCPINNSKAMNLNTYKVFKHGHEDPY